MYSHINSFLKHDLFLITDTIIETLSKFSVSSSIALKQSHFSKENQLSLKKIKSVNYQHPVDIVSKILRHFLSKFFEDEPGTSSK